MRYFLMLHIIELNITGLIFANTTFTVKFNDKKGNIAYREGSKTAIVKEVMPPTSLGYRL